MKNKRFLVIAYDDYYPMGGLHDVKDSFDTKEEAVQFAETETYENVEVYDRIDDELIQVR